jgi:hypothetical protein
MKTRTSYLYLVNRLSGTGAILDCSHAVDTGPYAACFQRSAWRLSRFCAEATSITTNSSGLPAVPASVRLSLNVAGIASRHAFVT